MRAHGLTLLEIVIALAIVGMLVAVSVPAVSSVTRAQLRQKSGQLAGAIRALHGYSALSGRSCRIAFDLEGSSYQGECARRAVPLAASGELSRGGVRERTRDEELLQTSREERELSEEDRERLKLLRKSAFAPSSEVPPTRLGGSVRFRGVFVQHQPERYRGGMAYLYFWPSGQTETASIQLMQGDDVVSLLVSPLTGRVRLAVGAVEAPGERQ